MPKSVLRSGGSIMVPGAGQRHKRRRFGGETIPGPGLLSHLQLVTRDSVNSLSVDWQTMKDRELAPVKHVSAKLRNHTVGLVKELEKAGLLNYARAESLSSALSKPAPELKTHTKTELSGELSQLYAEKVRLLIKKMREATAGKDELPDSTFEGEIEADTESGMEAEVEGYSGREDFRISVYEEPVEEFSLPIRVETTMVEALPGGKRLEAYENGSVVIKDGLGRVSEVHAASGDSLFLCYGSFGLLESFRQIAAEGVNRFTAERDRHGVKVRDQGGRVCAAGEFMSVDPYGRLYVHSADGQFFGLDLVTGKHVERRRVQQGNTASPFITAAFTCDGFRMSTMFSHAGFCQDSVYRFYGRDGTMIEFLSEQDLREMQPSRVMAAVAKEFKKTAGWQAATAWQSVWEYLQDFS